MGNSLRIVSDNAVARATLSAASVAGTLVATNMSTDIKSEVCRSNGLRNQRITATWATPETIRAIFATPCNLSDTATMRVRTTTEVSAVNLAAYSEDLTATGWSATNVTVTSNVQQAPDGMYTADKITGNGVSGAHTIARAVTVVLDTQYTISVFAKAAENNWMYLDFSGTGGGYATFNIGTGQLGANVTPNVISRSITPVVGAAGWYRVSTVVVPVTSGTSRTISISTQNADTGSSTSTSGGAYYWGLMVSAGALSSYYPSMDTFTSRASAATYLNSNGVLTSAATNVARMQLNLASPQQTRLLLEGAATNLLIYSEQQDHATYTKNQVTISGTYGLAPDGTTTARLVTPSTVLTPHFVQQLASLTSGTTYTLSFFVKNAGVDRVEINNGTIGAYADVTLSTMTTTASGGTGFVSSRVIEYPNNWRRLSLTFTPAVTSSQTMILFAASADGVFSHAGDGVAGMYTWGWQLEVGTQPTSYIPTVTSTVARSADVYTSGAGTRPTGYMDNFQSYDYDSGFVLACPGGGVNTLAWGNTPLGANAYSYGGGATARHFLPVTKTATALAIDFSDPSNTSGYVEISRMVIGDYWSPSVSSEYGSTDITFVDNSKQTRTEAGDLITDNGSKWKKVAINLPRLTTADRTALWNILVNNNKSKSFMLSIYPEDSDAQLEKMGMVYGRLVDNPSLSHAYYAAHATQLEIEES